MRRLRVSTKLAYGVGQVGEQVKTSGFDIFVFFYFQQVLGLSGSLAGLAVLLALAFDAVTDPIAGSLSDNWRSPRGRRHPFMYASALPLGLTWFLLFFPPAGLGQVGLFLWLTGFAILVRGSMTLYHVPHLAMGAELTSDYEERTSVVAYRTLFGLVGGVAVAVVGVRFFFPETPGLANGLLNPAGYPKVAVFGSLVMVVTIWYSAWGTRDQIPRLPRAPERAVSFSVRRVLGEFRTAWSNRSFRSLFVGFSFFAAALGVTRTLGTHLNVFFWEFPSQQIAILVVPYAVGFVVGVPLARVCHRRFDKKATIVAATLTAALLGNGAVLLRLAGWAPGNGTPELLALVLAFLGVVGTAAALGFTSAGSMMADVAQDHEFTTGTGQQGVLFAAVSFSGKLASGLGHSLAGLGIDLIAFPVHATPGAVAPELIRNLGILNVLGGAISLVGIYAFTQYTIDRQRHEHTQRVLAQRAEGDAEVGPG